MPDAPLGGGAARRYMLGYLYLATSNAGAKVAGLAREVLVAALFGASPVLGLYVVLKSGVEVLSVTATGAMQLSVVPRLARLDRATEGGFDSRSLFADASRLGLCATVMSATGLGVAVWQLGAPPGVSSAALVAILSLATGVLLVGVVGLIGQQARGQFGRMSAVYLTTAVLIAALVYPLGAWLGVVGLALAWLVGGTIQAGVVWWWAAGPAVPGDRTRRATQRMVGWADLRPGVMVAGNQMVLCLIGMKLFAMWEGLASVAVANYALAIAGLFVITVAKTMSSVVLKAAADGLSWRRLRQAVGIQLIASAILYVGLITWGGHAIHFLFERGSFDAASTEAVHRFLLWSFPGLTLLGSLDLLIVYANGRSLPGADRLFASVGLMMIGAAAAACAYAVVGPNPGHAPTVFVSTFAPAALVAAALSLARAARTERS